MHAAWVTGHRRISVPSSAAGVFRLKLVQTNSSELIFHEATDLFGHLPIPKQLADCLFQLASDHSHLSHMQTDRVHLEYLDSWNSVATSSSIETQTSIPD
ncbi:hypothetical protein F511_30949 [Dorcoceras hygrometricum]|uniref:Uncharacterized protein n=1 Tax=Dorcoceras hygrometricum TaxID=472368 RepID=A0A2Z7CJ23_9LAMI|nr:hypothetical protein F511_30949 [Dorcoceras hygrometricum]